MDSRSHLILLLSCCVIWSVAAAPPPGTNFWKAGAARELITPRDFMWMGGFGARTHPATGKISDLWAKALVFEDARGHRAAIVTLDLVAIRGPVYRAVLPRLKTACGLEPDQILIGASHTHSGPLLRNDFDNTEGLPQDQRKLVEEYSAALPDVIVSVVSNAWLNLAPARLSFTRGETAFAVNRRNNREADIENLIQSRTVAGPTDHSVPVLTVTRPDGSLTAVLFGYACHNTTLTASSYAWSGDYAGFAQADLERSHPGATALFVMGCGADQNPLPRGRLELAERYGRMLASAVEEAMLAPERPVTPLLETRMNLVSLHLGTAPTMEELSKLKDDPAANIKKWATRLHREVSSGQPLARTHAYPIQAWRFGKGADEQLLISLGGETVVDYSLKLKGKFGARTWVVGYANDIMAYVPSKRVLDEDKNLQGSPRWGYEGHTSMYTLGLPAFRWADDVEELITSAVENLASFE